MSILYGIINLKQQSVQLEHQAKMKDALLFSEPDRIYEWNLQNYSGGVLHRYHAADSLSETYPIKISSDELLSFAGRIDNHDKLIRTLNISVPSVQITDALIIQHAWMKWNKECVHHLVGDWSFVVYSFKTKECYIARDQSGNTGMYYYCDSDFLVYCSSLKGILALPFVDQSLNELHLAALLTAWRSPAMYTCYQNIYSLQDANTLTYRNGIKINQYWYPENSSPLLLKDEAEYFEIFRETFTDAVRCRLKGSSCVSLSSGLDSGAVASVAAKELTKSNQVLSAYISAPLFDPTGFFSSGKLSDESILAQSYLRKYKNFKLQIIKANDISVFDSLNDLLAIFFEPILTPANQYWIQEIFKIAGASRHHSLLTGQGGNHTISWPTTSFCDSINDPVVAEWKFSNFISFKKFRRRVIKPLVPEGALELYSKILYGNNPWLNNSMIEEKFAQRVRLKDQILQSGWYPPLYGKAKMHETQIKLLDPKFNQAGRIHFSLGTYFKVQNMDPTRDKRIIELCLSLPDAAFINKEESRRLVRVGLKQYLPQEIIENKKRGQQASDIILRMHHEKDKWISFKSQLIKSEFAKNYLNIKAMSEFIDQIVALKINRASDVYRFMRAASVFLFLNQKLS